MRRLLNWFVVLLSVVFLSGNLLLSGCDGGSAGDPGRDPLADTGMLRLVHDAEELESVLKRSLLTSGAPQPGPGPAAATSLDFSTTYTVEAGVDELDFVRYNGTHLFVAPRYVAAGDSAIRILRTDTSSASATQIGSIPLGNSQGVLGMYVANDRLFLIISESYYGHFGDVWPAIWAWGPSRFVVQVYDLQVPANPRQIMSATIDGG